MRFHAIGRPIAASIQRPSRKSNGSIPDRRLSRSEDSTRTPASEMSIVKRLEIKRQSDSRDQGTRINARSPSDPISRVLVQKIELDLSAERQSKLFCASDCVACWSMLSYVGRVAEKCSLRQQGGVVVGPSQRQLATVTRLLCYCSHS